MDSISIIRTPIESELEAFKELYDSSLSSSNTLLDSVVAHIRQRSGKMMRPILVLLVARLYGVVSPATLHAAVSLELLHNASLVHDDVVDESTERRGQLSVNAIFNNKVAVLTGDYLLATSLVHAELTNSHQIIRLVSSLGQDLADGELLQLSNVSNHSFSETVYFDVIRKKTAALFAACTEAAAYSVGVSEEEVKLARLLGEYIGICFQIKDDMLDYVGDEKIGKPLGNDLVEGKVTLPLLVLLERADSALYAKLMQRIEDSRSDLTVRNELIAYTVQNGGIDYAKNRMLEYVSQAKQLLASFEESRARNQMIDLLDWMVQRSY